MKTNLIKYLAGLIHIEDKKLEGVELDKKLIMSKNSWWQLPEKVLTPLYTRDALQKVVNFVNFTQPCMENPNATSLERMEELLYNFMDDYMNWASENAENFPITELVDSYGDLSEESRDELKSMTKNIVYEIITASMIQQYAEQNLATSPEDNEPEAA